ncbi:MAG TPA: L-threonylcarbamoyladenylate synthase [Solirubrobacteraceae bacterium]
MSLTPEDLAQLEECLGGDGVAVIPTDTVYGLACNPESDVALRRIYELKQRPPLKPAAVMFFTLVSALDMLRETGARTCVALEALLPGPVTLLLPNPGRRFPLACDPAASSSALLGLRVPAFPDSLASLTALRIPVAQSSANLSGDPDPRRLQDVPAQLREGADLTLDGGELPGAASTVIDLSDYERDGNWRIVREGPLSQAAVAAALT